MAACRLLSSWRARVEGSSLSLYTTAIDNAIASGCRAGEARCANRPDSLPRWTTASRNLNVSFLTREPPDFLIADVPLTDAAHLRQSAGLTIARLIFCFGAIR